MIKLSLFTLKQLKRVSCCVSGFPNFQKIGVNKTVHALKVKKKKNKYLCPLTCLPECIPTEPPSDRTRTPSNSLTPNPTDSPSEHPTTKVTKAPSKSPTPIPTNYPSDLPTGEPIKSPSSSPTLNPTDSPSEHPTIKPTKTPSKKPTLNPTDSPSASTGPPTLSPITSPTCVDDKTKSIYIEAIEESELLCEWVSKLPEDRCEQDCPCVEGEKKKEQIFVSTNLFTRVHTNRTTIRSNENP
mmetsp:Transcript_20710/g.41410  ORF Transcript_20710/g.41410 Transcript_20710/m.41410 type:complete len:241 (-) Transcript_20710:58-780(-)